MIPLPTLLSLAHLLGLALGVGSATVKLTLLVKCNADNSFVPVYATVAKYMTRQIIAGMVILTLSGIGWLLIGYPLTGPLVVKLVLVAAIWVLGPFIDNVLEPKFKKLAPASGEPVLPEFNRIRKQYLALEVFATGLFFVIIVFWVLV